MIREWDRDTGDLVTRNQPFYRGRESVGAGIYHRIRMFLGEFFLDLTDGTPIFQAVLGKRAQDTAEFALKQRIVTAPGVLQITRFAFDLDRDTRRIRVDCTVLTTENELLDILFNERVI